MSVHFDNTVRSVLWSHLWFSDLVACAQVCRVWRDELLKVRSKDIWGCDSFDGETAEALYSWYRYMKFDNSLDSHPSSCCVPVCKFMFWLKRAEKYQHWKLYRQSGHSNTRLYAIAPNMEYLGKLVLDHWPSIRSLQKYLRREQSHTLFKMYVSSALPCSVSYNRGVHDWLNSNFCALSDGAFTRHILCEYYKQGREGIPLWFRNKIGKLPSHLVKEFISSCSLYRKSYSDNVRILCLFDLPRGRPVDKNRATVYRALTLLGMVRARHCCMENSPIRYLPAAPQKLLEFFAVDPVAERAE